jgi:truncated hemoglobin YjbI/ankyrin repeat protein
VVAIRATRDYSFDMIHPKVAHRKGIATAVAELYPKPHLFQAIGGRTVVGKLIDAFYDRLLADPHLRPKFAADASMERLKQKAYFEEWLGGEEVYSRHYAFRGLQQIHHEIHVSKQDAARWLGHFKDAMEAVGIAARLQREILETLRPLAFAVVNQDRDIESDEHRAHRCLGAYAFFDEGRAAERGDVGVVAAVIKKHRRLLDEPRVRMQTLLFLAVGRGKAEVVKALLKGGADPNVPSNTGWGAPLQTPLCLALLKRKQAMVDLLLANGALDDVFTMAALGEVEKLRAELEGDRTLANVTDPAHDTFQMTPLYHAVSYGQVEAACLLFKYGAKVGRLSSLLVRTAAAQENVELLRLLLKHGADATRVGAGRWVIHPEISKLLDDHGADVNYAIDKWHSWIWRTCTGNNRNTDQPEVVAGIVARGVEVNSTKLWGRGALHFAAKAGFIGTVNVLLKNGADPNLRDDEGQTPLFYAFRAGKSIDPKTVVAALLKAGADPEVKDGKGKTVGDLFPKARTVIGQAKSKTRR